MIENENKQLEFFDTEYDKIVPQEEVKQFSDGIKVCVANKAKEMGIKDEELLRLSKLSEFDVDADLTEDEKRQKRLYFQEELKKTAQKMNVPAEKLLRLVEIDLEGLNNSADEKNPASKRNLASMKIKRGDFENIKYNLKESLNELEPQNNFALSTESIAARKEKISKASLLLYLSSAIAGVPILKDIIDKEEAKSFYGKKLSLEALAENPELIKEIDEFDNQNTPFDILESYNNVKPLLNYDSLLEFKAYKEYNSNNEQEKVVRIEELFSGDAEKAAVFKKDFKNLANKAGGDNDSIPLNKFIENKEKIVELVVKDLGIPEQEASNYMERFLLPDVSRISIVPLKDFKINTAINYSQKKSEFDKKGEELGKKYSDTFINGGRNDTAFVKDLEDLEQWAIDNKIDSKSPIVNFMNFKEVQELTGKKNINDEIESNFDQFRELFLKALEAEGESIDHLKEISKNNPEKIIETIAKVLGKNIRYDNEEKEDILSGKQDKTNAKHEKGVSFSTLDTRLGVCDDYAVTFAAAKHVLEKEGVPNLDKLIVLSTISDVERHAWTILITFDEEGKLVVSSLDLTWADDENISKIPEKLNAVDEKHGYSAKMSNVEKMHQKALNKILEYNRLVEQEKLREMIMQIYKKEYGILIDKE